MSRIPIGIDLDGEGAHPAAWRAAGHAPTDLFTPGLITARIAAVDGAGLASPRSPSIGARRMRAFGRGSTRSRPPPSRQRRPAARVRVHAAGLNSVDGKVAAYPEVAARAGVTAPAGFGHDYAGVIDEVCDGVSHEVAATLPIAGRTAAAAVTAAQVGEGDTVLIGGAAGGVGVFAVQLAVAAGATVIATASSANHEFLRRLGATSTTYGDGLVDRARELARHEVDAVIDLQGTATAEAALEFRVSPERIATIAADVHARPDRRRGRSTARRPCPRRTRRRDLRAAGVDYSGSIRECSPRWCHSRFT